MLLKHLLFHTLDIIFIIEHIFPLIYILLLQPEFKMD
jgi:hypothetical protein